MYFKSLFAITSALVLTGTAYAQNTRIERFSDFKPFQISPSGIYSSKIVLENHYDTAQITFSDFEYEPFEGHMPTQLEIAEGLPRPVLSYGIARKQLIAGFSLPLYFKKDGLVYTVRSFNASIVEERGGKVAAKDFASNSVLAQGDWYKFAVDKRGMVKLDYNFLQSLGINPANINPSKIRIYGNGGTVIPEQVSDQYPDDLVENAIQVVAAGSTFAPGDYILMYANGPLLWKPNLNKDGFEHTQNHYEDKAYYFLNFDQGPGKRVATRAEISGTPSQTINAFDDYYLIEKDSVNLGHIGKRWFGHYITRNNSISLPVDLKGVLGEVKLNMSIVGYTDNDRIYYNLNQSGVPILNGYINQISSTSKDYFDEGNTKMGTFTPGSPVFSLNLGVTASSINARTYLDFIRLNYKRPLNFSGLDILHFRSFAQQNAAPGTVVNYEIAGITADTHVWDVTNRLEPKRVPVISGTFIDSGNVLKEYVAFNQGASIAPTAIGKIENQNLHSLPQTEYLIITNNDLKPAAEELAAFHRTKFGTHTTVVTVDKIYNEFSSGGQDIGGIRNFIKMFYDRSNGTNDLKNVLMFGMASFDYKNRIENNTNIVPVFETERSNGGVYTYATDEYFTLLDEGESILTNNIGNYIDIGIGRIPARNLEDARNYIEKVKRYVSGESFGEWKANATFVTDDFEPGMQFLGGGEMMSNAIRSANRTININKIYADASPRVATNSGIKYPSITRNINNQIFNGTFLINYIGHGSPERWAVEEFLFKGDVDRWSNKTKLPIFITATCDFSRFDDPTHQSLGVEIIMKKDAGGIAALTTTADVYPNDNNQLNAAYIHTLFEKQSNGKYLSLGEAFMIAKNEINASQDNTRKFVVLGDPALRPSLPEHNVVGDAILEIDGSGNTLETDTIKALGKYILKGHIEDAQGTAVNDFNGQVYVTIYDKEKVLSVTNPTLLNYNSTSEPKNYKLQNNIIFKGNATVEQGEFSINIIIPKDINYDFGTGKIVYYAFNNEIDALGLNESFQVGGFSPFAATDDLGPIVKPYIDNNLFRSGDIVSENPMLYVELEDENGINVSGSSVGHDLIAILDGDYQNPYVLNSFYTTEPNSYSKGSLYYQLSRLSPGKHTVTVRAWDVFNNSGEGSIDFVVGDDGEIDFDLYNYPNPFTDFTNIVLQHNQPNVDLDVTLRIFATNGEKVYEDKKAMRPTESFTQWKWDGVTAGGVKAAGGVYLYQVSIEGLEGKSKTLYQKLVIVR
jgi:hypothetical protein